MARLMTQHEYMCISNVMGNLARSACDAGCNTCEEAFDYIYGLCENYKHDFYLYKVFPRFFMIECIKRKVYLKKE